MVESDEEQFECPVEGCERIFGSTSWVGRHFASHDEEIRKKVLLDKIHEVSKTTNKNPNAKHIQDNTIFSDSTYSELFGSWNNALREAGYSINRQNNFDKSSLLVELDRLAKKFDRSPKKIDMRKHGKYSEWPYKSIFGSWNDALREAGYDLNVNHDISNEKLLSELKTLGDKLKKTPAFSDMEEHGSFCGCVYQYRFGSWNNALRKAGFEPNRILNGESERLYYGPNWSEQRQVAVGRDNHQCKVSGKTIDEISTDWFHVHHITPAREFGAHDPDVDTDYDEMNHQSNLITLCPSVHARVEGKFSDCDPEEFVRRARQMLESTTQSTQQSHPIVSD